MTETPFGVGDRVRQGVERAVEERGGVDGEKRLGHCATVASRGCGAPRLEQIVELLFNQQRSSDPATRTIEERRDRLDGLARIFPLPDDVERSEIELGGVPAVRLKPPEAGEDVLFYLHGGGYGGGSALSHSELAARLARAAGAVAVLPEYRLAPEHTFPAALDDVTRRLPRPARGGRGRREPHRGRRATRRAAGSR